MNSARVLNPDSAGHGSENGRLASIRNAKTWKHGEPQFVLWTTLTEPALDAKLNGET